MTARPLWLNDTDEVLASVIKRFAENIPDYIEFLGDLYFCMKPFVLEAGMIDDIDHTIFSFDTYLTSQQRLRIAEYAATKTQERQFDIDGVWFSDFYSLRDHALPVIECLEALKPGLFKAEYLQDIVDCVERVEAAVDFDDLKYIRQSQVEFSLAFNRYFFAIERMYSKYIALYGWADDKAKAQSDSDGGVCADSSENKDRGIRRNGVRDATFLEWELQGMTPAKIRDRWNAENPGDLISLENASSGRDTVKKAIERERLRKTRGTR